ncbi:MAG: NAD(P)H-binding protein [Chloroflexi bacterium]|nr:NAD(P)H-binding protein [Chloroflexota bacterium]
MAAHFADEPIERQETALMILVTGATGFVGRHLVARLLAADYPVRLLLPEHKLRNLPWDTPPPIVTGTVLDEEALYKAVTGVHTVIHLENAQWWGRARDLERIEVEGTRNLIAAARAARIGRIIALSHLGAAPSSAYTLLRNKGLVEEAIRASGLAYTIIRTGVIYGPDDSFINHIAMQLAANPLFFLMPGRGEVVLHPLYIDDMVEVLIRTLELIETVDTVQEIGGAEYVTLEDLLRTVMRVSGMYRAIIPTPPYLLRWATAIWTRILPRSLITAQWLDLLATNRAARLGNIITTFGLQPRRFEDTLLTYMPTRHYGLLLWQRSLRRRPRGV